RRFPAAFPASSPEPAGPVDTHLQVSLRETCGWPRAAGGDPVRFTITALGGTGHTVDRVVTAIVRYLRPNDPHPAPTPSVPPATESGRDDGAVPGYYADSSDTPGRWLGRNARSAGLVGDVDAND